MTDTVTDKQIKKIPGWFEPVDWALFRFALMESINQTGGGDLAEIGAYLGKSAVLIGGYQQPGETFTVIDLFGEDAPDTANESENRAQYPTLAEDKFKANYLAVHGRLPVVVRGLSSRITSEASLGTHRFIHVDGSHLYEHVSQDVQSARLLLAPQGLVAFDDYRVEHTPGVAAAVWGALSDGFHPVWISPTKMYGTWGDPQPWREAMARWLPHSGLWSETQKVAGNDIFRIWPALTPLKRALVALGILSVVSGSDTAVFHDRRHRGGESAHQVRMG
jgi:Methyltransferase domain